MCAVLGSASLSLTQTPLTAPFPWMQALVAHPSRQDKVNKLRKHRKAEKRNRAQPGLWLTACSPGVTGMSAPLQVPWEKSSKAPGLPES